MNTSKNLATSLNLDDLLKRVENIVDEQIDELGKGKNRSSQNQLMKDDFARGNPYSPNARQVDDKLSSVGSRLRSEEDQKVVSNLADRLKENISRAIDEYSEGLYNQLQVTPAPCRCEEKGCHHPATDKAEQDGLSAASEEVPEELPPQDGDVSEVLASPPVAEVNAQPEESPPDALSPQVEDVTEVLASPPVPEVNAQPEESPPEASPPQVEDVTETLTSPPVAEVNAQPEESPPEASPPQVEDVTETPAPPLTLEDTPTEEVITAETAPTPEDAPQQGALFSSSFSFGQSAVEQPATPDTNDHSEDDLVCSGPSMEGPSPADSKAATEVNKAEADMEQINKQRLDQYNAKKLKFSL